MHHLVFGERSMPGTTLDGNEASMWCKGGRGKGAEEGEEVVLHHTLRRAEW